MDGFLSHGELCVTQHPGHSTAAAVTSVTGLRYMPHAMQQVFMRPGVLLGAWQW